GTRSWWTVDSPAVVSGRRCRRHSGATSRRRIPDAVPSGRGERRRSPARRRMAQAFPPLGNFPPPQLLADPYPFCALLRATQPVFRLPVGGPGSPGVWLLTRHADVHGVLRDARFSADRRRAQIIRDNMDRLPIGMALGPEGGLRTMLVM